MTQRHIDTGMMKADFKGAYNHRQVTTQQSVYTFISHTHKVGERQQCVGAFLQR